MSISKAAMIVSGFAATCALLGTLIGLAIGTFAPDVYRVAFSWPGVPEDVDPIQLGVGLGFVQGLCGGVFIGLVVVICVTWYETRRLSRDEG